LKNSGLAGTNTLDGASYTYDPAGNRISKGNYLNGITSNYTYDPLYQLTQVTQGSSTTESYSYDPVGNRLLSSGVPTYSYNSANELTSNSIGSYTYDANGNTLSDPSGKSYTWDFENRLTQAVVPGTNGGTTTFKYDPFGRRIHKISPNFTSIFVYDEFNLIESVNAAGAEVASYTQTQGIDETLAELRSSTTDYYDADGLGSITSLSSSTAALANTYTYDSFGKLTNSTGTLRNPFQYAGREFDPETGIYEYRARYYDSNSGRFISEDPLGFVGGLNFYAYVHGNSVNFSDPFGLKDYNEQQTLQILQQAYDGATSSYFGGLSFIYQHSKGNGPYDFGYNVVTSADTFTRCGLTMTATDFGNYVAGFQAGSWDDAFYGDRQIGFSPKHLWQLRYAEGVVQAFGILYHLIPGQSFAKNDPSDQTGRPWITLGSDDGRSFSRKGAGCPCQQ
jgi:RHS repeat-associated protein